MRFALFACLFGFLAIAIAAGIVVLLPSERVSGVASAGNVVAPAPAAGGGLTTGRFDTYHGMMTLTDGRGTFGEQGGLIYPENVIGDTVEGMWVEDKGERRCDDGRVRGRFRFEFNPRGFNGLYAFCDDAPWHTWNGSREPAGDAGR